MDQPQWAPPAYVAPPPPAPRRRRPWLVPVIVVSAVVLFVLLGLGVFALARAFVASFGEPIGNYGEALVEGEPGSPDAVEPLDCAAPCFTEASVAALLPAEAAFAGFGVPDATYPSGTYDPATVEELHRAGMAGWTSNGGTPDECVFAPSNAPYLPSVDAPEESSTDLVYFAGTHEDEGRYNTVDQAVRIFADSATATAYLRDLATNIGLCEEITIGSGDDSYSAAVEPEAALAVPDGVAAVGWVRTGQPGLRWRAYVVDMQRGNMVVRTRLLTDGTITELEFRSFVEGYARLVAEQPLN